MASANLAAEIGRLLIEFQISLMNEQAAAASNVSEARNTAAADQLTQNASRPVDSTSAGAGGQKL
jgi:hypothetical protein